MTENIFRRPMSLPEVKKPSAEEMINDEMLKAEKLFHEGMRMLESIDDMADNRGDYMVDERYASYYQVRNYAMSMIDRADIYMSGLKALKQAIHDAGAEE